MERLYNRMGVPNTPEGRIGTLYWVREARSELSAVLSVKDWELGLDMDRQDGQDGQGKGGQWGNGTEGVAEAGIWDCDAGVRDCEVGN